MDGPYEGDWGGTAYVIGSHVWETIDGGNTWILSGFTDDMNAGFEIATPA